LAIIQDENVVALATRHPSLATVFPHFVTCPFFRKIAGYTGAKGLAATGASGVQSMNNFDRAGQVSPTRIQITHVVTQAPPYARTGAIATIFRAGLVCGVLDISAAFITWSFSGVHPFRILQGIASGLLGPQAFQGGWPSALLGAVCHFFIAFSAATVFYLVSRKWKFLGQHATFSGVSYGIAVYFVMYWMVMPLSRLHPEPFSSARTALAIVTHIFCVGLPISLTTRRYSL
jgi:hypothetical protein